MNLAGQSIHVQNETDFENVIREKERVVAFFYAMWCPFCVRFLPAFEKAVAQNAVPAGGNQKGGLNFVMVEDVEGLEDNYGVDVVPTVLYFEKGILAKRLDGVLGVGLNESQLMKFLDSI